VAETAGVLDTIGLQVVEAVNQIEVKADKDKLYPDETASLTVLVSDALGNPLASQSVTLTISSTASAEMWFMTPEGITQTGPITIQTDESGWAQAICRAGKKAGLVKIRAEAAGAKRETMVTVEELKPSKITLETDKKELQANERDQAQLIITVLDQRGEPMPGIKVSLSQQPELGRLASETRTGSEGKTEGLYFIAGKRAGMVTITATTDGISATTTLTLTVSIPPTATPLSSPSPPPDTDGDRRVDEHERQLGTDPKQPDDKVKTPGNLVATSDTNKILLEKVPAGTVLLRSGKTADQGYRAVKLRFWVSKDNLSNEDKLAVKEKMPVTLERDDPNNPPLDHPFLTQEANGYPVSRVRESGNYILVELWGW
ncbi:MAG: invasin domain 3-containing protein, partial [candidate division WOR-3 bacterium]